MANIEQNNILCDSKKMLLTTQNEKVFVVFHNFILKKTFQHEVKGTDTVQQKAAQSENTFTVRIMGTVLTNPVRTSPGLPCTHL